jgi:hypothetical protein
MKSDFLSKLVEIETLSLRVCSIVFCIHRFSGPYFFTPYSRFQVQEGVPNVLLADVASVIAFEHAVAHHHHSMPRRASSATIVTSHLALERRSTDMATGRKLRHKTISTRHVAIFPAPRWLQLTPGCRQSRADSSRARYKSSPLAVCETCSSPSAVRGRAHATLQPNADARAALTGKIAHTCPVFVRARFIRADDRASAPVQCRSGRARRAAGRSR